MHGSRGRFLGVFAATLAPFLAIGAVLPVLPRYVVGELGGEDVDVGLVIGAFAFSAVVSRPLAGRLADRRGRRPIMFAGSLVMAAAGLLYPFSESVAVLVAARLVLGFGDGFVFTAGSAWAVDLAPPARRGQIIGLFGLAIWGGLAFGPPIGEALFALGGYGAVWAFTVAAPLAGALICLRMPEPPRPPVEGPAPTGPGTLLPRAALAPGAALLLANVGYAAIAGFVVLHLTDLGAAASGGGIVLTAFAFAVVGTRLAASGVPDRIGARRAGVAAILVEAAGLVVIAVAGSFAVVLAGAVLMGVGFSLMYPALALLVVEQVDERRRGAALGAFTAFFDAGVGIGGPLVGVVAGAAGYPAGFVLAAGCAVLGAAIVSLRRVAPR